MTAKFVLCQFGFFLLVGIVIGIISVIKGQRPPATNGVDPVALIFVNSTAAFLVLYGQLRKSRLSWRDYFSASTRWVPLLPVMLLFMGGEVIVASETGNALMTVMRPPLWLQEQLSSMFDVVGHPLSGPFGLIVVAAVTEEFLFRGLILRGLLAKISPVRALVISALLFAVMHLNPWQMPTAFIIGLILGWVYLRTRSLALCIAGHGFHNAVCLLASGLPFTVDGFNREHAANVVLHQPWWFNLGGLAVLAGGLYCFNRMAPTIVWAQVVEPSLPPLLPVEAVAVAVQKEHS